MADIAQQNGLANVRIGSLLQGTRRAASVTYQVAVTPVRSAGVLQDCSGRNICLPYVALRKLPFEPASDQYDKQRLARLFRAPTRWAA